MKPALITSGRPRSIVLPLPACRRIVKGAGCVLFSLMPAVVHATDWVSTTGNWTNSSNWSAGLPAANTLARINNGGSATLKTGDAPAGILLLGDGGANSSGYLSVGDVISSFNEPAPTLRTAGIYVGNSGIGGLVITSGATVRTEDIYTTSVLNQTVIANLPGSSGTITVTGALPDFDGPSSSLDTTVGKPFLIGLSGIGKLYVQRGGSVTSDSAFLASGFGSEGYALVSGVSDYDVPSRWDCGHLGIGVAGLGFLGITEGGAVNSEIVEINAVQGAVSPVLGVISVAQVEGLGSSLTVTGLLTLNGTSNGICGLNILDAGWVSANDTELAHVAGSVSVINLGGTPGDTPGTLETRRITKGPGIAELSFDGGCLAATESTDEMFLKEDGVTTEYALKVISRGIIVDTREFDVGIGPPIQRDFFNESGDPGGFSKLGSGTLTLKGSSTYEGETDIDEGTLRLTDSARLASPVRVFPGASLGGTGSVDNTVDCEGELVPGAGSTGTFHPQSSFFYSGSTLAVSVNGSSSNRLEVTGDLIFDSGSIVSVSGQAPLGTSWVIATATGFLGGVPTVSPEYTITIDNSTSLKKLILAYLGIQPATNNFAGWAAAVFTPQQLADPLVSGPDADPDRDGLVNFMEFAFRLPPLASGTPVVLQGITTSGLPYIQRRGSAGNFRLRIYYVRLKAASNPDLTYVPEFSSGLGSDWTAATVTTSTVPLAADWELATVDDPGPAGQTRRFGRVRVTLNGSSTEDPGGLVLIPAGDFTMGDGIGSNPYEVSHPVYVNAFQMARNLTTKADWDTVRTWGGSHGYTDLAAGAGKAVNHPVQTVSWWDVVKYCNARSEKEGLAPCYTVGGAVFRTGTTAPSVNWTANGYRLPTEAEWEKAARGGLSGYRFPWGDTITHAQANYNSAGNESYDVSPTHGYHPTYNDGVFPYTSPVGSFPANGFGLRDMAGNVYQWCWDYYGSYDTSHPTDPRGSASGSFRVFRGGCWFNSADSSRVFIRAFDLPDQSVNEGNGFRVARRSLP